MKSDPIEWALLILQQPFVHLPISSFLPAQDMAYGQYLYEDCSHPFFPPCTKANFSLSPVIHHNAVHRPLILWSKLLHSWIQGHFWRRTTPVFSLVPKFRNLVLQPYSPDPITVPHSKMQPQILSSGIKGLKEVDFYLTYYLKWRFSHAKVNPFSIQSSGFSLFLSPLEWGGRRCSIIAYCLTGVFNVQWSRKS